MSERIECDTTLSKFVVDYVRWTMLLTEGVIQLRYPLSTVFQTIFRVVSPVVYPISVSTSEHSSNTYHALLGRCRQVLMKLLSLDSTEAHAANIEHLR